MYNYTTLLVCGSRNYNDYNTLSKTLDNICKDYSISTIIHGDATGADRLGGKYGNANDISVIKFPAQWNLHGRGAGPIRNRKMLDYVLDNELNTLVVAFDASGRGTSNMVNISKARGLEVMII